MLIRFTQKELKRIKKEKKNGGWKEEEKKLREPITTERMERCKIKQKSTQV